MSAAPAPILAVDDNAANRLLVSTILRGEGRPVLLAEDGAAALAAIAREKPALVVLDLMMPGVDGAEVLRRLRAGPEPAPIVLLMTALSPEESERRARELGADAWMAKPFRPAELRARVRELLRPGER